MKKFLASVNAVCLAVLIFLAAVELPVFFTPFYAGEYEKYGIPESIGVTRAELMKVTEHMLRYMRGKEPVLSVAAEVNGSERDFFNDRERLHMADVERLFSIGFTVRNVCAALFALTLVIMILLKYRLLRLLPLFYIIVTSAFIALAGGLAFVVSRDFEGAFVTFHHVFFDNDLWILDPSTDLLVNIVPEEFFMDLAARIVVIWASVSALVIAVSAAVRAKIGKITGKSALSAASEQNPMGGDVLG